VSRIQNYRPFTTTSSTEIHASGVFFRGVRNRKFQDDVVAEYGIILLTHGHRHELTATRSHLQRKTTKNV